MSICEENTSSKSEAGFTLVELAVVMIIIGLLIGGVLKGQELISNAEVTSTIAQVKAIDAATSTFSDMYDAMPGDIRGPGARLPNCTIAPCTLTLAGQGNGRVDTDPLLGGAAVIAPGENESFFIHLSAADLMTGVNANCNSTVWGCVFPEAAIGGGFHAGFFGGGALGAATAARQGHYLNLTQIASAAVSSTAITPNQAFRIDNKLDDGNGVTGTVFANISGGDGSNVCAFNAGATIPGGYQESQDALICSLYLRFQN